MTFDEKVQAHLAQARKHELAAGTAAPLLWRLCWKLGWQLPPPMFLGFGTLALVCGSFFGSIWGVAMYWLAWRGQGLGLLACLGWAALGGLLFGLMLATLIRRNARRLKLPAWQDYPGTR